MVTDRMGILFEEFGKKINVTITPEQNGGCRIRFKSGVEVQIETSADGRSLMIGCELGSMPPGRYRENVFREALRANGLPLPRNGVFGFAKPKDSLYLCDQIALDELSGDRLFEFMQPFLQKAEIWRDALSRGEVPSYTASETSYSGGGGGGIFGLR